MGAPLPPSSTATTGMHSQSDTYTCQQTNATQPCTEEVVMAVVKMMMMMTMMIM